MNGLTDDQFRVYVVCLLVDRLQQRRSGVENGWLDSKELQCVCFVCGKCFIQQMHFFLYCDSFLGNILFTFDLFQ